MAVRTPGHLRSFWFDPGGKELVRVRRRIPHISDRNGVQAIADGSFVQIIYSGSLQHILFPIDTRGVSLKINLKGTSPTLSLQICPPFFGRYGHRVRTIHPPSGLLSICTDPPCCCRIRLTIASPNPSPEWDDACCSSCDPGSMRTNGFITSP